MKNPRPDPAPGASSSHGSGEVSAAIEGRDVAVVETTSAWTGEKKTRFESTPASMDLGMTVQDDNQEAHEIAHATDHEREQWLEQVEGTIWNEARFQEEINSFIRTHRGLLAADDAEAWAYMDDKQFKEMNLRLAIYRIKAHHKIVKGEELSIADIRNMYPPDTIEEQEYFEWCGHAFKEEWYFDTQYCKFAPLEEYQRIALPHPFAYLNWEFYHDTCSTLQSDREFVYFWETLSSKTEWIKYFVNDGPSKWKRIENVVLYHTMKIAKECTHIFTPLLDSGYSEYLWNVRYDNTWYKDYASLYFDIWKLVAKQKMSFKDALDKVKEKGMLSLCRFALESELKHDEGPGSIKYNYNTYVAEIDENLTDDEAYKLIMEAVKCFTPKRKRYYDYAKKKLDIAEKIGLIPSSSSSA